MNKKLIRVATIPISLSGLLKGQLRFMSHYYEVVGVASGGAILEKVEKEEGIHVVPVEMSRRIEPLKDLKSLIKLYLVFKKEQPHIVHSLTPKAGLLSMIAAYFAKVPIRMHTFTGLIFPSKTGGYQKLLIAMDKLLCACATHVYPEGNGVKMDLLKYSITSKPLRVIGNGNINGVDMDFFDPKAYPNHEKGSIRAKFGLNEEDFIFLFVGRMVRDKGVNEMIRAFRNIAKTHANVKLLLVGPFEEKLDPLDKETMQEIKSSQNIICFGWQDDVRPFFAISNCFLLPSYREGFPNSLLQAGAMEVYSIATDISGCNEIILNGENGTIIPPKDSLALENAMIHILENREELYKNATRFRTSIEERFERRFVWNETLKEYQKLEKNVL